MSPRFLQTLRLGLKSLLLHKLRSGLAILGILIGVTAVIWLVALGEGVSYQAQQQIKELGANNIIIHAVKPPSESRRGGGSRFFSVLQYGLLRDDLERIRRIPTVRTATPLREIRKEAYYLDRKLDIRLVGCTPGYLDLANLKLARGRFISDHDDDDSQNVCVLGEETANTLFPAENPLGERVQIDNKAYVVVGVTEYRMSSGNVGGSFSGQNYNRDIYIPLESLRWRIGDRVISMRSGSFEAEEVQLSQITAAIDNLDDVDATAEVVKELLQKFHTVADWELIVPKELLRQAQVLQMMFNVLLVLIASIALLVGGIGIMNIMLATVTERTREIGIRRALGAKQRDIVQQFLSETVVLSATGGLLGVLLGFCCGPAVQFVRWSAKTFQPDLFASLPANIQKLEPRLAAWSVAAAFLISVAVGVVFGLYPARRAALMDPIEALRHEWMRLSASVIDLTKDYHLGGGVVRALRGVSIDFPEGDFVAIMGASGSGKSTLLNLLGCLDRPSSGQYLLAGRDVSILDDDELSEIRSRHLGFIFQAYNLIAQLTVVENIELPLYYQGQMSRESHQRCIDMANLVGLGERLDHRPFQLSGGQQQRVAIARALVNDPRVILADEPTGNLDSATGEEIMQILEGLNRAGKTIIMVTHEQEIAERAKRILRMRDGVLEKA